MPDVIGLVAGSGFAAGVNLYATVLLLGLYSRVATEAPVPELLSSTPVLLIAGALTVVEFFADKVPWFDSAWDTVHTVIRPVGAAALATLLVQGDAAAINDIAAAGLAGGLAFLSHGAKASTRLAVNTSPEPFSNSIISVLEDGLVAGLVWLAVQNPALALVVVAVLALVAIGLIVALWRIARSVRQRMRRSTLRGRMQDVSR